MSFSSGDEGQQDSKAGSNSSESSNNTEATVTETGEGSAFTIGDLDKVVSARGTEEGLVLRIDGNASWDIVLSELDEFLGGSRRFFRGGEVSVEWLDRLPTKEKCLELEASLRDKYDLQIISKANRSEHSEGGESFEEEDQRVANSSGVTSSGAASKGKGGVRNILSLISARESRSNSSDEVVPSDATSSERSPLEDAAIFAGVGQSNIGQSSLFEEASSFIQGNESGAMERLQRVLGEELFGDEDANAKIMFGTLRSGQRVETPFSLIVVGDVNPGADLVAGGDIIILGSLRGTAHASAYDDDSFDNVIIAMQMQPMQLRIGSIISRGSDDPVNGVEIARIENRRIIVEPYSPRVLSGKRL